MQDVNSPYPDFARTDTGESSVRFKVFQVPVATRRARRRNESLAAGASVQKERKRTDNLRALNKLAQQRYR